MNQASTNASLTAPKILIVRLGMIGDCVMASHAVSALRAQIPDAQIVWTCESKSAQILDTKHALNQVVVSTRDDGRTGSKLQRELAHLRVARSLRKVEFDYAFDLHGHAKSALLTKLSNAKCTYALQAQDALAQRLLPIPMKFGSDTHWVERYFLTLEELPGLHRRLDRSIKPFLPRCDSLVLSKWGIDPSRPFVVVSTGGRHQYKHYPIERWIEIARRLSEMRVQTVFCGIASDPSPTESMRGGPDSASSVGIDLVGKTSLLETVELIARSSAHLAADTAGGHIAAALKVPSVAVFGPMNPANYRPWDESNISLKNSDDPRDVSTEQVWEATLNALHSRGTCSIGP